MDICKRYLWGTSLGFSDRLLIKGEGGNYQRKLSRNLTYTNAQIVEPSSETGVAGGGQV